MLQTMTGPLLLALRCGAVYWSLSEASHAQAFGLFVTVTPTSTPRVKGAFLNLGAELKVSAWEFSTHPSQPKSQAAFQLSLK